MCECSANQTDSKPRSSAARAKASGRIEVSVGKYVADDIFVSLANKFGQESVQKLTVEYAFTPRWSLETSTDTLGDSALDLFWKRRY